MLSNYHVCLLQNYQIFFSPDSILVIWSSPHTTFSPHTNKASNHCCAPLSFQIQNLHQIKCIKWAPLLPTQPTPSMVLLPTEIDQSQLESSPWNIPLFAASTGFWGEFLSNYHLFTLLYYFTLLWILNIF